MDQLRKLCFLSVLSIKTKVLIEDQPIKITKSHLKVAGPWNQRWRQKRTLKKSRSFFRLSPPRFCMRPSFTCLYVKQNHERFILSVLKNDRFANRALENHKVHKSPIFKGTIRQRPLNNIGKTLLFKLQPSDIPYIRDFFWYIQKGSCSLTKLIGT